MGTGLVDDIIRRATRNRLLISLGLPLAAFLMAFVVAIRDNDLHDWRVTGNLGLLLALVISPVALWGLVTGIYYLMKPRQHPMRRALARLGDQDEVIPQIETELRHVRRGINTVDVTDNWMVVHNNRSLKAMRLTEIVWLYPKTLRSTHGSRFQAIICDKHGVKITVDARAEEVQAILTMVAQFAPWAYRGYAKNYDIMWTFERGSLIAAVDQQRQRIEQARAVKAANQA